MNHAEATDLAATIRAELPNHVAGRDVECIWVIEGRSGLNAVAIYLFAPEDWTWLKNDIARPGRHRDDTIRDMGE